MELQENQKLYIYNLSKEYLKIYELTIQGHKTNNGYRAYYSNLKGDSYGFYGMISEEMINNFYDDYGEYTLILTEKNDELAKEMILAGLKEDKKNTLDYLQKEMNKAIQKYELCLNMANKSFNEVQEKDNDIDR